MFRVSTTPIIRSTQSCNYSLRYRSYFFVQLPPCNVAKLAWPLQRGQMAMFRVSTTTIIRSTQNCNYSLRYWYYFFCAVSWTTIDMLFCCLLLSIIEIAYGFRSRHCIVYEVYINCKLLNIYL